MSGGGGGSGMGHGFAGHRGCQMKKRGLFLLNTNPMLVARFMGAKAFQRNQAPGGLSTWSDSTASHRRSAKSVYPKLEARV